LDTAATATTAAPKTKRRKTTPWTWVSWLKVVVFILGLVPAGAIIAAVVTGNSGPNPIEFITHSTGEMALRLMLLGLLLSPLRWWFKSTVPIRFRRMVGLFAFFYVMLHFLTYAVLDQQLDVNALLEDVLKRQYVIAGVVSLLILIPLAVTSTQSMMRRLGKRWVSLHRCVYVAAIAAVLHYIWLAKGDQIEPLIYAAVLAVLLGLRVWRHFSRKSKKAKPA
jgi:methionine sulfoxide reductase heme-binding subunit